MKLDAALCAAPVALGERIAALHAQVAEVARNAGRDASSIVVLGVTKGHPRELAAQALAAGLTDIGENYLQEARPKYAGLGARKHFIGHVQTNKVRAIVDTFDVVQTVDSLATGLAILKAADGLGRPIRTLIQVKIADDKAFGADPTDAGPLARSLRDQGLAVDGVMAIGPQGEDPRAAREAFGRAAEAFSAVGGTTLSLGMSGDWPEAVACGSTMIRIGTAIFGERL